MVCQTSISVKYISHAFHVISVRAHSFRSSCALFPFELRLMNTKKDSQVRVKLFSARTFSPYELRFISVRVHGYYFGTNCVFYGNKTRNWYRNRTQFRVIGTFKPVNVCRHPRSRFVVEKTSNKRRSFRQTFDVRLTSVGIFLEGWRGVERKRRTIQGRLHSYKKRRINVERERVSTLGVHLQERLPRAR